MGFTVTDLPGAEFLPGGMPSFGVSGMPPKVLASVDSGVSAQEEDQYGSMPARKTSPDGDCFEDLFTMHLRGEALRRRDCDSPPKRQDSRANSTCPFSHEAMDSASAVDLRCGHRFAVARLGVARHATRLCCNNGIAEKDALICPLCGDQDETSKPATSQKLTTYSTNTDAYLGDLRKDWQRPLHLPMQTGEDAVVTPGDGPRGGCGRRCMQGRSITPSMMPSCLGL